ncbi:MAG: DUF5690 family protein [Chitinophagales bacterium]|nr:DUF5690 family protein [Chitinophagales bacterium]
MSTKQTNALTRWLSQNEVLLAVFGGFVAFLTYSCMYAFRKPFTAASFEGMPEMLGLSFKSALVISQVFGYTLSKFAGIKVVSEMGKAKRALAILVLIGIAEIALLGFAVVPPGLKLLFMFINGIPLGMIWGLVFSYLEGRKSTEVMGVVLCASFIFASGFVKTVGGTLMESYGVAEVWMPFVTGMIFFVPLAIFVWLLNQMPEPSAEDERLRTKREPMTGAQRSAFFKEFALGLVALIAAYVLLTAFRDFRDNFMKEITGALGFTDPKIFTETEVPVTLGVLGTLALLMFIKNNRFALLVNHIIIFLGIALAGISTYLFQAGMIGPKEWIMATGFATYAAYIPFNCLLFERLIATYKYVSTAAFLIYLADSFGYLGSVTVLLYKNYGQKDISWLDFFVAGNYALSIVGGIFMLVALGYFLNKKVKGTGNEAIAKG